MFSNSTHISIEVRTSHIRKTWIAARQERPNQLLIKNYKDTAILLTTSTTKVRDAWDYMTGLVQTSSEALILIPSHCLSALIQSLGLCSFRRATRSLLWWMSLHIFGTCLALLVYIFNFLNYFFWLKITDEGSVTEMRIRSISLIRMVYTS